MVDDFLERFNLIDVRLIFYNVFFFNVYGLLNEIFVIYGLLFLMLVIVFFLFKLEKGLFWFEGGW